MPEVTVGQIRIDANALRESLSDKHGIEIGEVIGHGGQRVVLRGEAEGEERAIKIGPVSERDRLEREVALARTFTHPSLARMYIESPLELEVGGQSILCVVEELVEGETLQASASPWAPCDAVELAEDLWSALDYLADRNVVHRDISPKNVMRRNTSARPRFVLLDVGIARHLDLVDITATNVAGPGTARYAAPEQFAADTSKSVDWRTDLFSLGVLLHEMLTGRLPYTPDKHGAWLRTGGAAPDTGLPTPWVVALDHLLQPKKFQRPRRSVMAGLLRELREDLECS